MRSAIVRYLSTSLAILCSKRKAYFVLVRSIIAFTWLKGVNGWMRLEQAPILLTA